MNQSSKLANPNGQFTKELENLMDALLLELIETPDAQILEGTTEQESLAWGRRLLDAAQREAGKRRLAAARKQMEQATKQQEFDETEIEDIPVSQARSYLTRISQDSRYTLAARKLGELNPEEVLRLYKQMRSLELVLGEKGWSS
jgi:hypothetical protein